MTVTITILAEGSITLETTGNEEVIIKTPIPGHSIVSKPGAKTNFMYGNRASIQSNLDNKE